MANTKSTGKADEAKPKRKMPTAQERVAALEAKLAEARARAEATANKGRVRAAEKRAKLVAKRDELTKQIDAIDAEYPPAEADTSSEDTES